MNIEQAAEMVADALTEDGPRFLSRPTEQEREAVAVLRDEHFGDAPDSAVTAAINLRVTSTPWNVLAVSIEDAFRWAETADFGAVMAAAGEPLGA